MEKTNKLLNTSDDGGLGVSHTSFFLLVGKPASEEIGRRRLQQFVPLVAVGSYLDPVVDIDIELLEVIFKTASPVFGRTAWSSLQP